jgi:hypothetical protein
MCEVGLCGTMWGPVIGSCVHGNDPSVPITGDGFLD